VLLFKYGHESWYEWCVDHWGTKWDAIESEVRHETDRATVHFHTAWGPPLRALDHIANRWPTLRLHLEFKGESGNGFSGSADWQDGVRTSYYCHENPDSSLKESNDG